jgi:hypothetical protein
MSRHVAKERAKAEPAVRALSPLKQGGPIDVFEQKNNGCVDAGENKEGEVNDFILCLGYWSE